jgi:hypothetical protein
VWIVSGLSETPNAFMCRKIAGTDSSHQVMPTDFEIQTQSHFVWLTQVEDNTSSTIKWKTSRLAFFVLWHRTIGEKPHGLSSMKRMVLFHDLDGENMSMEPATTSFLNFGSR